MLALLVARRRDAQNLEDACVLDNIPWQFGRQRMKVVSLSSAESENYSMVRCSSEAIGLANTVRELGHEAQIRIWSGSGAIKQMETKFFCPQQKEKNQELRIEKILDTVNPADVMTKHLDEHRLVTLFELFNIKRNDGRPSSALKLAIDTEKISRASRALAAVTLVKRATAIEIDVYPGAVKETWMQIGGQQRYGHFLVL